MSYVFRTLVLDNAYQLAGQYPLDSNEIKGCLINAQEAMRKVYSETATCIQTYPVEIKTQSKETYFWPSIIVLNGYTKPRHRRVVLTKTNIYFRDFGRCQYCGTDVSKHEMTLDHIIPKSRNGKHDWDNICLACRSCNSRKSDKAPKGEWANGRLYKKPTHEQLINLRRNFPVKVFDPN